MQYPSRRSSLLASFLGLPAVLLIFSTAVTAQLDIPDGGRRKPTSRGARELPPKAGETTPDEGAGLDVPASRIEVGPESAGSYSPDEQGRARFLFDQLARERSFESTIVREAEEQLVQLGAAGLDASRDALIGRSGPALVCAIRVLTRAGTAEDRHRAAERLTRKLSGAAAATALDALAEADPVLVSPDYVVSLLDHPTGGMRIAAERRLRGSVDTRHFAALTEVLRSTRRDARSRAVQLLATLDDPAVERVLIDRLSDRASTVAWEAATALADRSSDTLDEALVTRAFQSSEFDRGASYALLAIVEREDRMRRSLLDDRHVEPLRDALRSDRPLVVGAAATALAGIGFRSTSSVPLDWLDGSVPHELIRVASGAEFHADFGSLQGPAGRRLQRITGKSFGSDGAAWAVWWRESAGTFQARRAVLTLAPGDELKLELFLRDSKGEADVLLGPLVETPRSQPASSTNIVYLTEGQVAALVEFLREEGVLDERRLPRTERELTKDVRVLDVSFGEQGKRFELSSARSAPWFEGVSARARAFVEANSWQRFFPSSDFVDRHAFWRVERSFWENNADPESARTKRRDYVLAFLRENKEDRRDAAVRELEELCQGPRGRLSAAQLPQLFEIAFAERYATGRATTLLEIGLEAARGEDGVVPGTTALELLNRAVETWNDEATPVAMTILGASGLETTLELSHSESARARRFAAAALASLEGVPAEDRLLALLADPDQGVEVAAIQSLGRRESERARGELLLRARLSDHLVRLASLRAIGHLGGEGVRDALLVAMVEPVPAFNVAAVEALAELEDPKVASILARVFARGPEDPSFQAARDGLRRLGDHATDEILRLTASAAPRTRREAALLLAQEGAPEAAPVLIAWLTDHTDDARVGTELAILTGSDYRQADDPAESWWSWWDQVVHDDALAWYLGALEREGLRPPSATAIAGAGTREGALYLWERLGDEQRYLARRAERELGRLLGLELSLTPTRGSLRDREVGKVRMEIDARFAQ